jgi:hypothetical protein
MEYNKKEEDVHVSRKQGTVQPVPSIEFGDVVGRTGNFHYNRVSNNRRSHVVGRSVE